MNYVYQTENDLCRFKSVATRLTIEITMPQLVTKVSAHIRKWYRERDTIGSRPLAPNGSRGIDDLLRALFWSTCGESATPDGGQ